MGAWERVEKGVVRLSLDRTRKSRTARKGLVKFGSLLTGDGSLRNNPVIAEYHVSLRCP